MQTQQETTKPGANIERLKSLIAEQIVLARRGDISALDPLAQQADVLVMQIAQTGGFERQQFADQRAELRKLYEELNLILKARLEAVGAELAGTRKAKKTLKVYKNSTTVT